MQSYIDYGLMYKYMYNTSNWRSSIHLMISQHAHMTQESTEYCNSLHASMSTCSVFTSHLWMINPKLVDHIVDQITTENKRIACGISNRTLYNHTYVVDHEMVCRLHQVVINYKQGLDRLRALQRYATTPILDHHRINCSKQISDP
jgi:hypothetical protein